MTGPLKEFRIVDTTSMVSGPSAAMLLADQGADVIKVENPEGGDHTRASANTQNGFSANFLNNNRNKRSVTLNLKDDRAKRAFLKICETSDVFIQNFRPGVADRIGIGEADIRAVREDIIYVSICGFGESGPYAAKPVYDPLIQALSGLATVQGGSDEERPRLVRTILPDKLTGIVAAQAITAALLARTKTGRGQHVRLSMLDTIIAFLWGSDMGSQTFVDSPFPQQKSASFIDLIYETADGYISVAVQSDREWQALTRAVDQPDWLEDERFKTPALRQENIDDRLNMTQEMLRTAPSAEWLARLEAEDVPCAPVLTRSEAIRHPQVAANAIVLETDHHLAGRVRQARPAAQFSETPLDTFTGGPGLGEHTREVLAEAGCSEETIAALAEPPRDRVK
ncbi:MAG: CoA transferase [Pseudomonadota bacterium]|jgi:crotonobetainyl-CoA:carnitine CoA-transferase CaiB-like acyl-CoA transferase|nr:CoA transferase [Pseudomonadota bacterium]